MRSGARLLLAVAIGVVLIVSTIVGGAAWAIYGPGSLAVHVAEKTDGGASLAIRVPAILLHVAAAAVPVETIEIDRTDPAVRMALPIAAKALEALERVPDAVLVEVDDGTDHVRIAKEGDEVVIHVDSDEATLDVSVPLSAVRAITGMLERAATAKS
jgi:hypothetical protein